MPLTIGAVAVALLSVTGNSWFLLLVGVAAGALAVGLVSPATITGLVVSVDGPIRVAVGHELTSTLTVSNIGRRTSTAAAVTVRCAGLSDAVVYVGPLRAGESAGLPIKRTAARRGVFRSAVVEMRARPSLGLRESVAHVHRPLTLRVHPRPLDRPLTMSTTSRRPDEEERHETTRDPGTELLGLRDWQHGDGMRRVHWRATARHGRLVVAEQGQTTDDPLRLLLVGPSEHPGFEDTLAEAAAVCDEALRTGRHVVVAVWTAQGLQVAPDVSRLELLDWWAGLTTVLPAGPGAVDQAEVERLLGRGVVIVAAPGESIVPAGMQLTDALPLGAIRLQQVGR